MARDGEIDIIKGVGIVSVIVGHIFAGTIHSVVTIINMPLFFFLSGYLFSVQPNRAGYLQAKAIRLLVPYTAFITLFYVAQYLLNDGWNVNPDASTLHRVGSFLKPLVLGGQALAGWAGVAWFTTTLFLTQQTANLTFGRWRPPVLAAVVLLFLALAYVNSKRFPHFWLPWNANVVLMGLPLFYAGYLYRRHRGVRIDQLATVGAVATTAIFLLRVPLSFNMKFQHYGTPILALLCSLSVIVVVFQLARRARRVAGIRTIAGTIGQGSLVIMFVHQPLALFLQYELNVESGPVRLLIAVSVSAAMYLGIRRVSVLRALFLGSRNDLAALFRRRGDYSVTLASSGATSAAVQDVTVPEQST